MPRRPRRKPIDRGWARHRTSLGRRVFRRARTHRPKQLVGRARGQALPQRHLTLRQRRNVLRPRHPARRAQHQARRARHPARRAQHQALRPRHPALPRRHKAPRARYTARRAQHPALPQRHKAPRARHPARWAQHQALPQRHKAVRPRIRDARDAHFHARVHRSGARLRRIGRWPGRRRVSRADGRNLLRCIVLRRTVDCG